MVLREENAAGVAQPHAISRPPVETNVVRKSVGPFEHPARLSGGRGIVDDQFNPLMPGQIANDFRVDPRNRLELPWPVSVIVGPRYPGGGVRLPLRGHAVAKRGRKRRSVAG